MTGTAALREVAGWDVAQLRSAVGVLGAGAERLVPWRSRLDAVGRQLGGAQSWSGPAGTAAAAALLELVTVAGGVSAALDEAHHGLVRLVVEATEAQLLATMALAAATAGGVRLDGAGLHLPEPRWSTASMAPGSMASESMAADQRRELADRQSAAARAEVLAGEALAAAARAVGAATAAAGRLDRLGGGEGRGPVTFDDLCARLAPSDRWSRRPCRAIRPPVR